MKVILTQDVAHLGRAGSVVKVKDGYARNMLIPRKMAYSATDANVKVIERQQSKRQAEYEAEKKKAQDFADKLSKVSCTVNTEVNDLDKLYGAVSETDIAAALEVEGVTVDRKNIIIEKPIEELGRFEVGVKLHPEVTANIRVWVTKK